MWTDDISFCPIEKCRRKTCRRNQQNIRDRTVPHSFFVERPPDCPYRKKQDDFYHIRKKAVTTIPDREKVTHGLQNLRDAIATDFIHEVDQAVGTIDDALALLKDEKEYCDKCAESAIKTTVELQEEIARLCSLLKEQPQIVRCKDCKHILPKGFCHKYSRKVANDWFCADGVKRE